MRGSGGFGGLAFRFQDLRAFRASWLFGLLGVFGAVRGIWGI